IVGCDPVAGGVVASPGRPGGNITGVAFLTVELEPKRLELLLELVPKARSIALLANPNNPTKRDQINASLARMPRAKGVEFEVFNGGAPRVRSMLLSPRSLKSAVMGWLSRGMPSTSVFAINLCHSPLATRFPRSTNGANTSCREDWRAMERA